MLPISRIFLFFKGVAMGAADVVPGVSGGTIAFITGIYEELLETLANLDLGLLKTWRENGFKAFWKAINGNFLLTLFAGIFTSLLSLAVLVEYLMHNYPIILWSFFFGLIVASVWLIGKQVKWNVYSLLAVGVGTLIAYYITTITPVSGVDFWWYIILSGSVAITAMILPGISGSFILLLMGMYASVLGALSGVLKSLAAGQWTELMGHSKIVLLFIIGCLAGLILFSKGLNWLFKNHKNITIAVLTGFLIGSLNKIYPWKEVLKSYTKHAGEPNEEIVPLVTRNISPAEFTELTKEPNQLGMAVVLALTGVALIVILDKLGTKK